MTPESQAIRELAATVKMAHGLSLRTVDVPVHRLEAILAELEQLLQAVPDPETAPAHVPVEVTCGPSVLVYRSISRIEYSPDIDPLAYSLDAYTDGVLRVAPGSTIRILTHAEIDQIDEDWSRLEEEADRMMSAGAYDPDYGKDLDYD